MGGTIGRWLFALALGATILVPIAPPVDAATRTGNFVVSCRYSHSLPDDPIVFPGLPGASHLHDFFGNITTTATSTVESMLAGTAMCKEANDTAGYWAPTAYMNGVQVSPLVMRIYYLGQPNEILETIPPGLQMIGGNKDATSPAENPHVRWFCGSTRAVQTPRMDRPYDCTSWAAQYGFVDGVVGIVDMPSCWDGVGLLPGNVTYRVDQSCPSGFPHVLPRLSQRVHFGIMNPLNPDGSVALSLSSGPYHTLHSDFWNTWQQERLDQLVENCLVAGVHCGDARTPREIAWTRQFGTSRYDHAFATETDATGVYVVGFTKRALEGQVYLGQADAFVRKYDPAGNELWTRQFGTPGFDQALGIAVDATGVYVSGSTDGTFPGRISNGGQDAFVRKFGLDGDAIWTNQFGTAGNDQATGITLDAEAVYVAGSTDGIFSDQVGAGGPDTFVRAFARGGLRLWTRQFGTSGVDRPTGIAADDSGMYIAGTTDGVFPGQTGAGMTDGFLAKYDAIGTPLWTRQFGTSGLDQPAGSGPQVPTSPSGIAVDDSGAVYLVGTTDGVFPGQTGAGMTDGFLAKYDASGAPLRTRQFGTADADEAFGVALTFSKVNVAGSTLGAFPTYANQGGWDLFVRRHLPGGKDQWTFQFGTPQSERAFSLSAQAAGMYVAGWIHGAWPGETYRGDRDVFVVKVL